MDQENKKISFGFTKSTKKTLLFEKVPEKSKKIQLIDCLEAQKIKIKNAKEVVKGPLIIPMVQAVNLLDRRRDAKREKITENAKEKPESELTVEELAARELIREAQNNKIESAGKLLTLVPQTENILEIDGKPEPTLEDYESVPICDYGMAMLRGMGWNEGMGIGKKNKSIQVVEPSLRPKGMGLGASSAQKKELAKPAVDKNGKELILQKGCFAKIIDGKKRGCYCEVQGFDEEAGRVIVKTSLDGLILSLNEFLLAPVTKEEFSKSSKVINIQKYEQYKDQEGTSNTEPNQKHSIDSSKSRHNTNKSYEDENSKKHKQRIRTSSTSSTERRKVSERSRRYSSTSDDDRKYNKVSKKHSKRNTESSKDYTGREKYKSKKKLKKYRSSSSSSVENDYEKRGTKGRKHSSDEDDYNHKREKSKSEKYKTYSSGSDLDSKYNHRKEKHRHSQYSHSSHKRK